MKRNRMEEEIRGTNLSMLEIKEEQIYSHAGRKYSNR